jgi:REP element-mobilizing transposase RayT
MSALHKYELDFFTATVLEWRHLFVEEAYKDIVLSSLKFLTDDNRITINAFVIMSNHLHILWHIKHPHVRENVQRDFLRYTAQMILKDLRNNHQELQEQFRVNAKDRKYQVWERNALTVPIWTENVLLQKLDYIHNNPVKAGLCTNASDYKYSSAAFYDNGGNDFDFLKHYHYE